MDTLRTAVLAACCTALALTLSESVLPTEKFRRQLRLLMTLLLMTAILKSLTELDFSLLTTDFQTDFSAAEELSALTEAAYEEAIAARILNALNSELDAHSVSCTVQSVSVHIQDDGGIEISEAVITGNTLTGTVYLREWLGDDVTITKEADE